MATVKARCSYLTLSLSLFRISLFLIFNLETGYH